MPWKTRQKSIIHELQTLSDHLSEDTASHSIPVFPMQGNVMRHHAQSPWPLEIEQLGNKGVVELAPATTPLTISKGSFG